MDRDRLITESGLYLDTIEARRHVAGGRPLGAEIHRYPHCGGKKPVADRLRPTTKPVELIERALANSSKAGDVVLDLFGGWSSTLPRPQSEADGA